MAYIKIHRSILSGLFREIWTKQNVSWSDNGAEVEFAPAKTFFFREDLSAAPEDLKLTVLNIPMIVSGSCP